MLHSTACAASTSDPQVNTSAQLQTINYPNDHSGTTMKS